MSRLVLLSLIVYILILAGLGTLNNGFLALAGLCAIFLLSALWFGPNQVRLLVRRNLSAERVVPNMPVTITLSITNEGEALEQVWLSDQIPEGVVKIDGQTSLLTWLAPKQSVELRYTVRAERGSYHFGSVTIYTSDRLGLVKHRSIYQADAFFAVLPDTLRLPHIPIRPRLTKGYAGMTPANQGGPGIAFYGVREYQTGDALRWVNWRASARHQQTLYSNEFEQERAVDVSLVLDARHESYFYIGNYSLFEHAITATASLAQSLLNDGNRVGLMHYGQYLGWTFPGYGKLQRERILYALAQARLGQSQVDHLEHLPTRLLLPGSQIVLISPLLKKDVETLQQLRAHGYSLLVISPDPVSFERRLLPESQAVQMAERIARLERMATLRRLQQAGIIVLDWDVNLSFNQAILALTRGASRFAERRL